MKKKKIGQIIIVVSFLTIICFSWFVWYFVGGYVDTKNYENREMATMPQLTLATYPTFAKEFDAYFNDSLPFRSLYVTLHTAIDYSLFHKSSNENVIIGKDNWLFFASVADGNPIGHYLGTNLYPEDTLKAIAENLIEQRNILQEQGIEFVLFIAPNKERIYYDKMPDCYGLPADQYAAKQLVDYLRENTDIRVVYPFNELMAAREVLEHKVYYRTDTHWNDLGAYIGSKALLHELGIEIPDLDELTIREEQRYKGDLANMLHLPEWLTNDDNNFSISGYESNQAQAIYADFFSVLSYKSECANRQKLYVLRDSFASHMGLYIASQFSETYMRHRNTFSSEDYLSFQPDIFVFETVERYVDELQYFSVQ